MKNLMNITLNTTRRIAASFILLGLAGHSPVQAHADKAHVDVADAWIRPTVEGQKGTGGFLKITARDEGMQLVGISTTLTKAAEVHEMRPSKADANVMEMREVKSIPLPKGTALELKPGGYHLMFMDLKQVLKSGDSIPVTLRFTNAKGQASKLDVMLAVGRQGLQAPAGATSQPAHKH
jgi:periplasmic copper chaperone A